MVTPLGPLPPRLEGHLIPGDADQQPAQLCRIDQIVLSRSGTDEEAGQHRLANVHRVKRASQIRVAQAHPDLQPDGGLELLDQLRRSLLVAAADAPNKLRKRGIIGHRRSPSASVVIPVSQPEKQIYSVPTPLSWQ